MAAISEDGFDLFKNHGLIISNFHIVNGKVETDIFIAGLATSDIGFGGSSIEYVIDGSNKHSVTAPRLLGRRYRYAGSDAVFLEHEIRTGDPERLPVFVTGNTSLLGSWDAERALPLSYGDSGRGGHHWRIRIPVLQNQTIEFKFLKKEAIWEEGDNRTFSGAHGNASTSDNFRE